MTFSPQRISPPKPFASTGIKSIITALFLASSLVACGGGKDTPSKGKDDSSVTDTKPERDLGVIVDPRIPKNVATTDEPITLPAQATGLAFWAHPNVSFQGLIIAATSKGIFAHTLEGAESLDNITGSAATLNANGIALAYMPKVIGGNTNDRANKATAVFTAYDQENKAFRFFEISNASRKFTETILSIPYSEQFNDFCLATNQAKSGVDLYILSDEKFSVRTLGISQSAGYDLSDSTDTPIADLISCASDPSTRDQDQQGVFALSKGGDLIALPTGETIAKTQIRNPAQLSVFASKQVSTASPQDEVITRQFVVLDKDNAYLHILEGQTGNLQGVLKLADFDEIKGVINASDVAAGSGNFGGLYRFGAIALSSNIDNDEAAAVRLTPFLAVARSLELPVRGPVNLRSYAERFDEDSTDNKPGLDINIGDFSNENIQPEQ